MTAPERIWLSRAWASTFTEKDERENAHPYILATPEALAASPEVQALIAEAVKAAVLKSARVRLNKPDKAPRGHYYGTYALGWTAAVKKLRALIRAGTEGGG